MHSIESIIKVVVLPRSGALTSVLLPILPVTVFLSNRRELVSCRLVGDPVHVDGKVFLTTATPISVIIQTGVLELVDLAK
jgi:hypothetical protein